MNIFKKEFTLLRAKPVRWMAETALLVAISALLQILAWLWSKAFLVNGGTFGIEFITIIIAFYRLDFFAATLVEFIGLALYSSIIGGWIVVNPWQFLLDYCPSLLFVPIAGLCALWFKHLKNHPNLRIYVGITIFTIISLVIHYATGTISGILFWSSGGVTKGRSALVFSLIYNSYLIPSYLASGIIVMSSAVISKRFFTIDTKSMYV